MAKKIVLAVVVAVLICVAIVAIPLVGALLLTQPVVTAGDAFMVALRDRDYTRAYELCSDDLKTELENVQGLETLITNGNVQPITWNFSSRNVNGSAGQLSGEATFGAERTGNLELILTFEDGQWKVTGFNLQET